MTLQSRRGLTSERWGGSTGGINEGRKQMRARNDAYV